MPLQPRTVEAVVELSAQHVVGESVVEDDGRLLFVVSDDEDAVEVVHDIGDLYRSADHLEQLGRKLIAHADRVRSEARSRTASWTSGPC